MMDNWKILSRPRLFQPGDLTLWSNAYIASNVLKRHLDTQIDSGSRKPAMIDATVDWLSTKFDSKKSILDIGCGPGLYARPLCQYGFNYTGIDISPYQIEYAQRYNTVVNRTKYICSDFRTWMPEQKFDIALLLYGIYSFYSPDERHALLVKLRNSLSRGGCAIAEVFTTRHFERRTETTDWEYISHNGFWSPEPYLELNAFRRYEREKTILIQAIVIDDQISIWNSWMQLFETDSLIGEFMSAGFTRFEVFGSCSGDSFDIDSDVLCLCAY